jgi:hypothetical protein
LKHIGYLKKYKIFLKVRLLAVQLTPLCAILSIGTCGASILWLSIYSIKSTNNGLNCTIKNSQLLGNWLTTSILAIGFSVQLTLIASNYVRIIHHVRRKFWQRKARGKINIHTSRFDTMPLNCAFKCFLLLYNLI